MPQTLLEHLQNVDPAVLLEVVRQDQRSPGYQILDWSARLLTSKGQMNPEGLQLVEGRGYDNWGETAWRVVVKNMLADPNPTPPGNLWYSKRELEFFQSGLLDRFPGNLATPRCYLAEETSWGMWIWLEYIQDQSPERWNLDHFAFAAREIGRWNACGYQSQFLPDYDWLCQDPRRDWLVFTENSNTWRDRSSPFLRKVLSEADQGRAVRILDEKENWLALTHRLPQIFSHYDVQRRNLLIRKSNTGQDELVVLDWANVGIGPLGAEVLVMVGGNVLLFEIDPEQLAELDQVVFDAYVAGLQEGGWSGNPELVRLGYTAWFALFAGAVGPAIISLLESEDWQKWGWQSFNCGPDDLTQGWAQMVRYALDRADEARLLIDRLAV